MAKKKPTISIIVALRNKDALEGLSQLNNSFLAFSKAVDPAIRVVGVGLKAVTAVIGTVTTAMSVAATTAMEFDTALRAVTTIADASTLPLSEVRDLSYDLAKAYGTTATENARNLYEVISAGVSDAATAQEVLRQANELSIGGLASVQSAVSGLTSVVNAYGAGNVSAARAADALTVAAADGSTRIEELAQSMGLVTPIASSVGVTIEEVASAVAVLTANGIPTATAVEYVRSALANIIKPSKQAIGVARELGIAFGAQTLAAKGLSGFLEDVVIKSGATSNQVSKLIGDIGGFAAVTTLTKDGLVKLNESLAHQANNAGRAHRAFETMSAALGHQVKVYDAVSDAAATAFGELLTSNDSAAKALAVLNDGLSRLVDYLQQETTKRAAKDLFDKILYTSTVAARAVTWLAEAFDGLALAVRIAAIPIDIVKGDLVSIAEVGRDSFAFVTEEREKSPLVREMEDLRRRLKDVALGADEAKINIEALHEMPELGLGAGFGFEPRFAGFKRPDSGADEDKPKAKKETAAERDARLERARARAQDAEGMAAVMEDERRDAQLLNEILLEDQLAAYNARLEAEREFAKQMQEAIRERGRQTEEEERSANRAQVDAANEGLQDLMEYTKDATDQLQGIKDLFADGPITAEEADVISKTASLISGVFASMFMEIGEALGSGNLDGALEALGSFFGNMLKTMGGAAIQLGSLLGVLGIVGAILGIAPLAAALPYAGALIVAGVAAVAAGTALGAGGGDTPGGRAAGGGAGRSTERDSGPSDMKIRNLPAYDDGATRSASGVPRRGVTSASEAPRQIVIEEHVHFDRGMVVASSGAEAGRQIEEWRSDAARLRGERDPWRR